MADPDLKRLTKALVGRYITVQRPHGTTTMRQQIVDVLCWWADYVTVQTVQGLYDLTTAGVIKRWLDPDNNPEKVEECGKHKLLVAA